MGPVDACSVQMTLVLVSSLPGLVALLCASRRRRHRTCDQRNLDWGAARELKIVRLQFTLELADRARTRARRETSSAIYK